MIKNLLSEKVDSELERDLMLFGQFIGNWKIQSIWFLPDNIIVKGEGEVSFGWILYGTAIQDVWTGKAINPPKNFPNRGFGTTIRFFNTKINAWNCIWIAPIEPIITIFEASKIGDEILLEGKNAKGEFENWIYSNIRKDSFDWRSQSSKDRKNWIIDQKISAIRI